MSFASEPDSDSGPSALWSAQAATLNAEMDAMDEEIRSPRPAAASTMGDVTFGSPKEIAAA